MPNDIEVFVRDEVPLVCERRRSLLGRSAITMKSFFDEPLHLKEVRAPMKEAPTRMRRLG